MLLTATGTGESVEEGGVASTNEVGRVVVRTTRSRPVHPSWGPPRPLPPSFLPSQAQRAYAAAAAHARAEDALRGYMHTEQTRHALMDARYLRSRKGLNEAVAKANREAAEGAALRPPSASTTASSTITSTEGNGAGLGRKHRPRGYTGPIAAADAAGRAARSAVEQALALMTPAAPATQTSAPTRKGYVATAAGQAAATATAIESPNAHCSADATQDGAAPDQTQPLILNAQRAFDPTDAPTLLQQRPRTALRAGTAASTAKRPQTARFSSLPMRSALLSTASSTTDKDVAGISAVVAMDLPLRQCGLASCGALPTAHAHSAEAGSGVSCGRCGEWYCSETHRAAAKAAHHERECLVPSKVADWHAHWN